MDSTSPGSSAVTDSTASGIATPQNTADRPAIYFDGTSSRQHVVEVHCGDDLAIVEDGATVASWPYADLRVVDGGKDTLRLKCLSSLPLARLEIFDPLTQAEIRARARSLDKDRGGGHVHTGRIVAWSLAAIVSILLVVTYGVPLAAERLTPLVPLSFEQHLGAIADNQVRAIFRGRTCTNTPGQVAFSKLVEKLSQASHLYVSLQT